jgi:hypothetical protein
MLIPRSMIPLSVLDLAPILQGGDATQAFEEARLTVQPMLADTEAAVVCDAVAFERGRVRSGRERIDAVARDTLEVEACLRRAFAEEFVGIRIESISPLGFLYDPHSPVGTHHMAFIHEAVIGGRMAIRPPARASPAEVRTAERSLR